MKAVVGDILFLLEIFHDFEARYGDGDGDGNCFTIRFC